MLRQVQKPVVESSEKIIVCLGVPWRKTMNETQCQHCGANYLDEYVDHSEKCPNYNKVSQAYFFGKRDGLAMAAMTPIPMRLPCEKCGQLHIDEGEFAEKSHHTHACQCCGHTWRPAIVPTVGVRFLPGFQNVDHAPDWSHVLPHQLRVSCSKCTSNTNSPCCYEWEFKQGSWICGQCIRKGQEAS